MSDEGKMVTQHDDEPDEVEAHATGRIAASDEGGETEEDDFEAHRAPKMNRPGKLQ